jgi:hypothetical protein
VPVPSVASTTSSGAPTVRTDPLKCALAAVLAEAADFRGVVLRDRGAARPTDA